MLNQTMGVETHVVNVSGDIWTDPEVAARIADIIAGRKAELEARGHRVLVGGAGGAHPDGYIAHALTFREMLEQSDAAGIELDFVYHTIGTGTALPGMLAAKLSLGHPVRFRSISTTGSAAIRELAQAEGVFVGPVYTGKGLAGLLDHAPTGRIPAGSDVAFVHTGDTGNLFEIPEVVGRIAG